MAGRSPFRCSPTTRALACRQRDDCHSDDDRGHLFRFVPRPTGHCRPRKCDRRPAAFLRTCFAAVDAPEQVFPRRVHSCSCIPHPVFASLRVLVRARPRGPRMGESGRGPAAPRSSDRNGGRSTFFPCRATPRSRGDPGRRHSSRDKKVFGLPSSAALRPFGLSLGCGSIAPGRSIAIAVAIGAARRETGD